MEIYQPFAHFRGAAYTRAPVRRDLTLELLSSLDVPRVFDRSYYNPVLVVIVRAAPSWSLVLVHARDVAVSRSRFLVTATQVGNCGGYWLILSFSSAHGPDDSLSILNTGWARHHDFILWHPSGELLAKLICLGVAFSDSRHFARDSSIRGDWDTLWVGLRL